MKDYFEVELTAGDRVIVAFRGSGQYPVMTYKKGTIAKVYEKMADVLVDGPFGDGIFKKGSNAIFRVNGPEATEATK
jgi:hypothetical protein